MKKMKELIIVPMVLVAGSVAIMMMPVANNIPMA